jgi:hypothetical protein
VSNILDIIDQARNILFEKGMEYPNYKKSIDEFRLTEEEMLIVAKALHLSDIELSKPIPPMRQNRRK